MARKVLTCAALAAVLAAAPAGAWRTFAAEVNAAAGWPGVRIVDDADNVVAVVSFVTPSASFSVITVQLSETMEAADIAVWNEFDKKEDPVFAKRLNGATPGFNASKVKIYDYLPEEAWEKCGGNAGFINHQVRLVVGYLKGGKWKKLEVDDYQPDPAMMGVTFELAPLADATAMGPICWGYWYP
jgi:hypothetical protein